MRAPVLLLSLVLGGLCAAQDEGQVVRDEWRALYEGGEKFGWEHQRILEFESAAAGAVHFVLELSWSKTLGERVTTRRSRTETDAKGRVLGYESSKQTPYGEISVRTQRRGESLRYAVKTRELPEKTGSVDQVVWSSDVVGLLVLRGDLPVGEKTLPTLDLPGKGTSQTKVSFTREDGGWKVRTKRRVTTRAAGGSFVSAELIRLPGGEVLPATKENAPDMKIAGNKPSEGFGVGRDWIGARSVGIRRPSSEWLLMAETKGPMEIWGLEHPSDTTLVVMTMPMNLPAGEAALRLAEQLRKSMNERGASQEAGLTFGEPALVEWRGQRSVHYPLTGQVEMTPAAGDAYLMTVQPGESYLVFLMWPKDLSEVCAPYVEQARQAVEFKVGKVEGWKRVTLESRVSVEVPMGWKLKPGTNQYTSPAGGSRIVVIVADALESADYKDAQRIWFERQRSNPRIASMEIERREVSRQGERTLYTMVLKGVMKAPEGQRPITMRSASCTYVSGKSLVEITIVAFDFDWDLPALERVMKSVRWVD